MTLDFEAIYDGEVLKPKTPIDLPEGTKILITEIIREEGKPVKLIGHVQNEPPPDGARGDQPDAADKEGPAYNLLRGNPWDYDCRRL